MNTDFPKVSIGLVTYNHADFVVACLDSIRLQDYPHIELWVSDDASKDGTVAVIEEYRQKHPDFITHFVAQKTNLGITDNCNFLLDRLTGVYCQVFSGDDIMLPTRISAQVAALNARPDAVFCFSNMEWFWSATDRKICNHFGWLQAPSIDIARVLQDFSIPSPTLLVRRTALGDIRYNKALPYINDCLFMAQLMMRGAVVYVPDVLVRYRKHRHSATLENYFYEERKVLLGLLTQLLPSRYAPSLARYRYTVDYARIMTLIAQKQRWAAFRALKAFLPVALSSRKWTMRLCAVIVAFLRSI